MARVYNREREYPTVNMSPESNVTFDHSHSDARACSLVSFILVCSV